MVSEEGKRDVEFDGTDDEQRLRCPGCDGTYLHHRSVEWFERDDEDADLGRYVNVAHSMLTQVSVKNQDRNPSARRDGLRLWFACEQCDLDAAICIVQHKGQTYVYWEVDDNQGG
jgi:hypothetical protein